MIRMAREMNRLTITATQMMESMITTPVPTRAEVSDVANAVLDGTDAVMLSAESASGKYPVEAVEAMHRICVEADRSMDADVRLDQEFMNRVFTRVDQAIAMTALFAAHHLKVKAIVALTQSGSTALWMSRLNSGVPIFALTPETGTYSKLALFRDTRVFMMPMDSTDRDRLLADAEALLVAQGVVDKGDFIVITIGEPIGKSGGTNTLKIVRIGEH
jgi:pyruvate kinase